MAQLLEERNTLEEELQAATQAAESLSLQDTRRRWRRRPQSMRLRPSSEQSSTPPRFSSLNLPLSGVASSLHWFFFAGTTLVSNTAHAVAPLNTLCLQVAQLQEERDTLEEELQAATQAAESLSAGHQAALAQAAAEHEAEALQRVQQHAAQVGGPG